MSGEEPPLDPQERPAQLLGLTPAAERVACDRHVGSTSSQSRMASGLSHSSSPSLALPQIQPVAPPHTPPLPPPSPGPQPPLTTARQPKSGAIAENRISREGLFALASALPQSVCQAGSIGLDGSGLASLARGVRGLLPQPYAPPGATVSTCEPATQSASAAGLRSQSDPVASIPGASFPSWPGWVSVRAPVRTSSATMPVGPAPPSLASSRHQRQTNPPVPTQASSPVSASVHARTHPTRLASYHAFTHPDYSFGPPPPLRPPRVRTSKAPRAYAMSERALGVISTGVPYVASLDFPPAFSSRPVVTAVPLPPLISPAPSFAPTPPAPARQPTLQPPPPSSHLSRRPPTLPDRGSAATVTPLRPPDANSAPPAGPFWGAHAKPGTMGDRMAARWARKRKRYVAHGGERSESEDSDEFEAGRWECSKGAVTERAAAGKRLRAVAAVSYTA